MVRVQREVKLIRAWTEVKNKTALRNVWTEVLKIKNQVSTV